MAWPVPLFRVFAQCFQHPYFLENKWSRQWILSREIRTMMYRSAVNSYIGQAKQQKMYTRCLWFSFGHLHSLSISEIVSKSAPTWPVSRKHCFNELQWFKICLPHGFQTLNSITISLFLNWQQPSLTRNTYGIPTFPRIETLFFKESLYFIL